MEREGLFGGIRYAGCEARSPEEQRGYWPKNNRYIVFQALPHTLGLEVEDDPERKCLRDVAAAAYPPCNEYQAKTLRQIPVFIAEPA